MLLTAILFGLAFIFQRHGAQYANSLWFNSWRFAAATTFLSIVWFIQHRIKPASSYGRWIFYGAIGGIFMFGGIVAQQWGLAHTTVGKSGFLTGLYVVFVPLITLFFGQKLQFNIIIAIIFAGVGLWLFAGISNSNEMLQWNIGDYATLFGTLCWSFQVLWMSLAVRHANVLAFSVMQILTVFLLSTLGVISTQGIQNLFDFYLLQKTIWDILYTGIGSGAIAFLLQAIGQRQVRATHAAVILSSEAIFALFFGWLILSEQLNAAMLIGCAFMFAAMLLAQCDPKKTDN